MCKSATKDGAGKIRETCRISERYGKIFLQCNISKLLKPLLWLMPGEKQHAVILLIAWHGIPD